LLGGNSFTGVSLYGLGVSAIAVFITNVLLVYIIYKIFDRCF
jgi:hypothetical protein